MEAKTSPLKLNFKRTFIIGFAFFGILLLWQVYDSWCPTMLTELFKKAFDTSESEDVQYLVGAMMALDNLAALVLLPVFGNLSDKTHTKIGKRMPYILIGTFVCAIAFPFIPVFFHLGSIWGVIAIMAIVVFFAMMYRNPAVALMPDITPKPLRSKANGIINIMGYIGGAIATVIGIPFAISDYLKADVPNIWTVEIPFLVGSVCMVISCIVLFLKINENKIEEEMRPQMEIGEQMSEAEDAVTDDGILSQKNKKALLLILAAEFFWFMADNAISTFMGNYTIYFLGCKSSSQMINTIIMGVGSVLGFAFGGGIAEKFGRKWTLFGGLALTVLAFGTWAAVTWLVPVPTVVGDAYNSFPVYLYIIFLVKGFGMSLVHVNSFPMVVELCPGSKVGKFTGYYYASSMAAQTVTPFLLGLILLLPSFDWKFLPLYAVVCCIVSLVVFFFVGNVKSKKSKIKKGLEAFDED